MPVKITTQDGQITSVTIPRPNFSNAVRKSMPTKSGEDLRHVVAWAILRDVMIQDLTGKTPQEARDYLTAEAIPVADSSWNSIETGIKELAQKTFDDMDNLYTGPSPQNRILGSRITSGKRFINLPDKDFPRPLEIKIVDENGNTSMLEWTLYNREDAEDFFYNMAIDWNNVEDIDRGKAALLSLLDKTSGPNGPRGSTTSNRSGSQQSGASDDHDRDMDIDQPDLHPVENHGTEEGP